MPFCRTLLVLLLGASVGWGAELRTLNDAQDEGFRKDGAARLARKRRRDVLVVRKKAEDSAEKKGEEGPGFVISGLEGTAGEGDETGTQVEFAVRISDKRTVTKTF